MDLSNLKPALGSIKKEKKRLGRGQGSGKGGTSTKGHKGAKSRSGYSSKRGFEGGQMPIQRTSPKYGFRNINRVEYKAVNLKVIEKLATNHKLNSIDPEILYNYGIIPKNCPIKILGVGELTKKVEIKAHAFSNTAIKAIENAQGTVVKL